MAATSLPRRRPLVLLGLALPALRVHAATTGSGRSATEVRAIGAFEAISLRGDIDLVVRQGTRESLQVTAEDNLLTLLHTRVETHDGRATLRVAWAPGERVRPRAKATVTVEVARLAAIAAAGSGDVTVSALRTSALALALNGSSDARLDALEVGQLQIALAGSGDIRASGKAARVEVSIAGSGDVEARDLAADEVAVSIAGSGDARVHAAKTLAVSIAGSGSVEYGGGAVLTSSQVAGSGRVRQRR